MTEDEELDRDVSDAISHRAYVWYCLCKSVDAKALARQLPGKYDDFASYGYWSVYWGDMNWGWA